VELHYYIGIVNDKNAERIMAIWILSWAHKLGKVYEIY